MKNAFILGALALAISGCSKSEFALEGVAASNGMLGNPDATYVDREDRKPITGTIRKVQGEVELLRFNVVDGVVHGEWIERDTKGGLRKVGTLEAGKFVGSEKTYCQNSDQLALEVDHQSDVVSTTKYECTTGLSLAEYRVSTKTGKFVGPEENWAIVDGKQVPTKLVTYSADGEGKIDGAADEFYHDGSLKSHKVYVNGVLTGDATTYTLYTDGTHRLASKTVYQAGEAQGKTTYKNTPWPEESIADYTHYEGVTQYGSADEAYRISYGNDDVSLNHYRRGGSKQTPAEAGVSTRLHRREVREPSAQSIEEIKFLVKNSGVDLNAMLSEDSVPVLRDSNWRYRDVLLSLGADPDAQDLLGKTELSYCLSAGRNACKLDFITRLIREEKPSVDKFGNTPLILLCRRAEEFESGYRNIDQKAIREKTHAAFDELLKKSDVHAVNMRGRTALHECLETGYRENRDLYYAKALITAGADGNKTDISGFLPTQLLFVSSFQPGGSLSLAASPEIIEAAVEMGKGTNFSLKAPFPIYDKSLKEIFMESGNASLAMQLEKLGD